MPSHQKCMLPLIAVIVDTEVTIIHNCCICLSSVYRSLVKHRHLLTQFPQCSCIMTHSPLNYC